MWESLKKILDRKKTICIVGLGGLGTNVAKILAESNVANLVIIDEDRVEGDNLHRQVLYEEKDIGKLKAHVAKRHLHKLTNMNIKAITAKIDQHNIYLINYDLVLDCTDNMESKLLINKYCHIKNIPWIYCSVAGALGFIRYMEGPCLQCFTKKKPLTAESLGVLPTAVSMAASIFFCMAIQRLPSKPDSLLINIDAWNMRISKSMVKRNPKCEVCR